MSSQRNPLTESIDELLNRQCYDMPFLDYITSRAGIRDLATGTSLAGLCFVAAYFVVCANVF